MTDDAGIERIACGLIDRTLPKPEWTHRAHFAAALWLLSHPDVLAKAGGMAPIIRQYNEATGVRNNDSGGYHARGGGDVGRQLRRVLGRRPG